MLDTITFLAVWIAAISTGLMAGIYFSFSGFIMKSFEQMGAHKAVPAMNAINKVILHSPFMPLFFGSSLLSLALVFIALFNWQAAVSTPLLIASSSYFIGMFLCTVFFNVPLNKRLASTEISGESFNRVWRHYLKNWTRWNHIRTVSSLLACLVYIYLLQIFGGLM